MKRLSFRSAGLSHVGRVRRRNEDAWLARPDIGLWVVADGMGGHARGEVASGTIIAALDSIRRPPDARGFLQVVEAAIGEAHARLVGLGEQTREASGSTVAALLAYDRHFALVWAGDSRIYRLHDRRLERLTHDHRVVQELVDSGWLSPEEAEVHPLRNQLTRGIGTLETVELERRQGELAPGDVFLLCTDGLTEHLADDEIEVLIAGRSPEDAARELVEETLQRGASDNVTVIVVAVEEEDPDRTHRA